MAINLLDELGRKDALYQWDVNRMVVLDEDDRKATRVDFIPYRSEAEPLAVETREYMGMTVADIPNLLLQSGRDIVCYSVLEVAYEGEPRGCCECCADGGYIYSETISEARLQVVSRNRPPDYTYSPTKVIGWESMKQWVRDQIKDAGVSGTDYDALENKPSIAGVVLEGDKALSEFGLSRASELDIDRMFDESKE